MKWAIFAISAVHFRDKNRGENVGLLGEIPAFEVQFRRKTHVFAAATMEKNKVPRMFFGTRTQPT